MISRVDDTARRVADAIARCSVADLKVALFACNDLLLGFDEYPARLFQEWLTLLSSDAYDRCPTGWLLLQHLYNNAEMLTVTQKQELAPILKRKFAVGNEKQSFIVVVLLGEVCEAGIELRHLAGEYAQSALGNLVRDALNRLERRQGGT
jgi:hypothetical protein